MRHKKRGAIELSMTTIIVIVIGVTLLSLGLVFVRNIFKQTQGITDDVFNNAKEEINLDKRDPKLTAPAEVHIGRGETKSMKMYLTNDGTTGSTKFTISIDQETDTGVLQVKMFGTPIGQTKTLDIPEGEEREIRAAIVVSNQASIGSSYNYNVLVNNGDYDEKGFVVIVEK